MKTEVRLNSVVAHGVGSGPESAAIDLIYIYLLHEFGQDIYRRIGINQIGDDLNEFVAKEPGNMIHVNIRYPAYYDFEAKSIAEKNRIRLDVIHTALLRVAEYDNKLDVAKLEAIRKKILEKDFLFDFILKAHENKKNPSLVAKVVIHPLMDKFIYYAVIEENGKTKCKQIIFTGIPSYFYADMYFYQGKWKNDNEFIISGKEKTVETRITVDKCAVEIINLTPYSNPPYYTLMRLDATDEERRKADEDWKHSMHPAVAAIIRQANN
jgi:hypothetical protein